MIKKILFGLVLSSCLFCLISCKHSVSEVQKVADNDTTKKKTEEEKVSELGAIYIASNLSDVDATMKLARRMKANAVIIDIKDDFGRITCDLGVDKAPKAHRLIKDISKKLQTLKDNGFYTIARIVSLKDSSRRDLCIKNPDKSVWFDKEKMAWLDIYNPAVQDYLLEISKKAVELGFDEIQYDYMRFSTYTPKDDLEQNSNKDKKFQKPSRCEIINEFLKKARDVLHAMGAKMSVDVFGYVIEGAGKTPAEQNSEILGQDYVAILEIADFVCPMIYPSHFEKDSMGIEKPDLEPYKVILKVLEFSNKMIEKAGRGKLKSRVRPYLQAFTAGWLKWHIKYSNKEINEQIQATKDSGLKQWSLFQSAGRYPE